MPQTEKEMPIAPAPHRQPADGQFLMHQIWHHLLFLHWRVEPEQLQALLPAGLRVDTFDGQAYVGLIPFTMTGVRAVGLPALPRLSAFHEVNVRTYVRPRDGGEAGVWFFSLDAASWPAVRAARATYKLPYHFARMNMTEGVEGTIRYTSARVWPGPVPAECRMEYQGRAAKPASAQSLEHFLVERYMLYTRSSGRLYCARVYHTPYPLQGAVVKDLSESLLAAAGIARPDHEPLSLYSRGVTVRIGPLRPVIR